MESIVLSSEGREPRAIRAFAEVLESHSAFLVLVSGQADLNRTYMTYRTYALLTTDN